MLNGEENLTNNIVEDNADIGEVISVRTDIKEDNNQLKLNLKIEELDEIKSDKKEMENEVPIKKEDNQVKISFDSEKKANKSNKNIPIINISSQPNEQPSINQNNNFMQGNSNFIPSPNNINFPQQNMNMYNMDKEKLFETFLLFQNFMSSMNNMGGMPNMGGVNNMNMNMMQGMMNPMMNSMMNPMMNMNYMQQQNQIPLNSMSSLNSTPTMNNVNFHSPMYNPVRSPIKYENNITTDFVEERQEKIVSSSNLVQISKSPGRNSPVTCENITSKVEIKTEELKITTPVSEEVIDKTTNKDTEDSRNNKKSNRTDKSYEKQESNKEVPEVSTPVNSTIVDQVKDPPVEIKTNDIKRKFSKSRLNSSKIEEKSQDTSTTHTKPSYNLEDVPIKTTQVNFLELLEKNLANMGNMPEEPQDPEGKAEKRVHKPRFKKVINVSKPTEGEAKKYKYYSDNFDENKKDAKETRPQPKEEKKEIQSRNNKFKGKEKGKEKEKERNKLFSPKKEKHGENYSTNKEKESNSNSATNKPSLGKPKKPDTLKSEKSSGNLGKVVNTSSEGLPKATTVENSLKKLRNMNKEASMKSDHNDLLNNEINKLNWGEAKFEDLDGEKEDHNKIINKGKETSKPNAINKSHHKEDKPNLEFKQTENENKPKPQFSIGFVENQNQINLKTSAPVVNNQIKQINIKEESESEDEEEEENQTEGADHGEESTVMFGNLDNEFLENIISGKLGNEEMNKDSTNKNSEQVLSPTNKILENRELLNSKIKEINYEIIRLKGENEKVTKLKIEYEKLTKKLNFDLKDLNERKERELSEFEAWKEEEVRRIQKERKIQERNLKQVQNQGPTKKEKEEIETLKLQIIKMQDDWKIKDNTNKLMIDRLKKQLEEANLKIVELTKVIQEKDVKSQSDIKVESKQSSSNLKKQNTQGNLGTNNKSKKMLETGNNASDKKERELVKKDSSKKQVSNTKESKGANTLFNTNTNLTDEGETESYDLIFPDKYHNEVNPPQVVKSERTNDGKVIRIFENGKREVVFPSGVIKEIHADGYQIVYFTNKDIKQIFPNGKTVYYFNEAHTVQTTFPDNFQIFKFENGQIEKHYTDGSKQISFPDGSLRYILLDGYEETFYPDGTLQKVDKNGIVTIEREDGVKEVKYPDGREEVLYPEKISKSSKKK